MKNIEVFIVLGIIVCLGLAYERGRARIDQEITRLGREHPSWSSAVCHEVARGRFSEEQIQRNPDWPWTLIARRKIQVRMTEEMVRLSWGRPTNVFQIVNTEGTFEMWTYSEGDLFFRNGILLRISRRF